MVYNCQDENESVESPLSFGECSVQSCTRGRTGDFFMCECITMSGGVPSYYLTRRVIKFL